MSNWSEVSEAWVIRVSAQTIYTWESGKGRPRWVQLAAIAARRSMGEREIKARLQALAETSGQA